MGLSPVQATAPIYRVVPTKRKCHKHLPHSSPCGVILVVGLDGKEYQDDTCACGCTVVDWCMEQQAGWRSWG